MVQTPPKFQSFDKAESNSLFCGKYIHNNLVKDTGFTHLQIEQNPCLGGYHPKIPVFSALLSSTEFVEPPLPPKIPGYATAFLKLSTR
jgi:hypothetical protein